MIWLLAALFVVAMLFTAVLTPKFAAYMRELGRTAPAGDPSLPPVPLGGGLVIAIVLSGLFIAGGTVIALARMGFVGLPHHVGVHLNGAWSVLPTLAAIAGGAVVIFVLGAIDDRKDLSPWPKLLVQLAVGVGLALCGVRFGLFAEELGSAGPTISIAITALWIAGITNAFNLLDHADGTCATVALSTGLLFAALAVWTGQWFIAGLLVPLLGCIAGFLLHNRPPATVFLGDSGSQLIGYLFAVTTVLFTFYDPSREIFTWRAPLFILAVPLFDTAAVALGRIRRGQSPFARDKAHLTHRLVNAGLSPRKALVVLALLTLFTGMSALALYQVTETGARILSVQTVVVLGLITLLPRPDDA
jgi:UDP-GlcNAc:undecaprenyl-phosphate GlcNAc-1-phosphate transferase